MENIGLAAHLAVFDIRLGTAGGFIHCGLVPFATARALEASFHQAVWLETSGWRK
jgi:hypothetical protein